MGLFPKIVYDAGAGPVTLQFLAPVTMVPGTDLIAVRHDNIASSGVRETILERIDEFLEFTMQRIVIGADLAAWDAFMRYALQGGTFDYYPDAELPDFSVYTLEETGYNAAYKWPAWYTFKTKFRKWVVWPV
jgi:hypothetical protein